MRYKYFYRAILLRVLFIIFLAGGAAWLCFENHAVVLCIVLLLVLVMAVFNLIRYFSNVNRWISYFLLGIENEDTSLKVPGKTGNKALDDVYKGMERLNELFRKTKMEIYSQEQYFHSVINQSVTGLFSVNEKGRVVDINPVAEKLTQLKKHHHINILQHIDVALPGFILKNNQESNRPSAIFSNRYGQKLLFKMSEIFIRGETIKLVAVSDITKELDNREVDAWIKLARTLSHEIMNNIVPITTLSDVIMGYFTKKGNPLNEDEVDIKTIKNTVKGLTVIKERSEGLMNFVENYRKFTKLPEPQIMVTDLVKLLDNNLIAATAFSGFDKIKLQKELPSKLMFPTDEKLFSQVLLNLFKNAVEALSSSGDHDPALSIVMKKTGSLIEIKIMNNGPVIPPELREQIFVPFFTTKEGGSGIGLSLGKQIMLSLGGDIVLSISDQGQTIFTVTLV